MAILDALGERLANGEVANLLVEFLDVNAGLGAVRHAATTPDGVAPVTDPGAAGAFLAPRFCAGAGDFADRLGASVAGSLGGIVGDDRLVDGLVALVVVHGCELGLLLALVSAVSVLDCYFHFLNPPLPLLGFLRLFLGLANDDVVAVGTGDGSLDEQQVVVGLHLNDLEVLHRATGLPHVAGHVFALGDVARR